MCRIDHLFDLPPYGLDKTEKAALLTPLLKELTAYHQQACPEYAAMLRALGYDARAVTEYAQLPFLPVGLFKDMTLRSVPEEAVFKTVTSSGTTGQKVSHIVLDRETAALQQKVLVRLVSSFTGKARLPLLIIDSPSLLKNRRMFSVRGAGVLGFSIFGSERVYALDEDMRLDKAAVTAFAERHKGERVMLFGFTFMVWQHFCEELHCLGQKVDLSNAVLIHGGGWKKLASLAISPEQFAQRLQDVCGLREIHDYYGMVEQAGSIHMQCEAGHLHTSIFSDVIMRRARNFSPCPVGEAGIVQTLSVLPKSYPGHSLLTEDEGVLLGEDDCPCGRKGKYFKILGRLPKAELRGCSDTYASQF